MIVSVIGIAVGILSGCGEKEYWQDEHSRKKWAGEKQALSVVAGIWQKVEETVLCPMGDYPEYGGGEDFVSYFQDRYPDMYRLSAYLWGEDTLWNFEESMFEDIFYEVESPDGIRGFFRENGKVHEIFSENGSAYDESVQGTKQDLGYDYYPFFTWKKEGEGNTSQSNYLTDVHDYMREIGDGKGLRIQAEAVKRELREKISGEITADSYIFQSRIGNNQHIGRNRAYVLIKKAWSDLGYEGNISCHSLRKSFGYHAWHNGVSPAVIMNIYNHSSMEVTKRYLSIAQDDKDDVYRNMDL